MREKPDLTEPELDSGKKEQIFHLLEPMNKNS